MILICLLYTCGVWIESVDPAADLCLTNQVLYRTILSSGQFNKEITLAALTRVNTRVKFGL